MIKRAKESTRHNKYSLFFVFIEEHFRKIDNHFYHARAHACCPLSSSSSSSLYCSVFWPRWKVLPSISLFFLLDRHRSICCYTRCPMERRKKGRKKRICFLFCLSNVKWLSPFSPLSPFWTGRECWVALFQDNFIQSVGQCCIDFLCSLDAKKKKRSNV